MFFNQDGQKGMVRGSSDTYFEKKGDKYFIRNGYVELGQTMIGDIQATKDVGIRGADTNTLPSTWIGV